MLQAVRVGDVVAFKAVLAAHEASFRADLTLPLIARLHQNVIKTGLRKISLTYVGCWAVGVAVCVWGGGEGRGVCLVNGVGPGRVGIGAV